MDMITLWGGLGPTNPPLELSVAASSRLIRVADGRELSTRTFTSSGYESNRYKFRD